MARSLAVTLVSSAAITSQAFNTSNPRKEISRALPIGVARIYRPAAKSPRLAAREAGDLPVPLNGLEARGLSSRVKGFSDVRPVAYPEPLLCHCSAGCDSRLYHPDQGPAPSSRAAASQSAGGQ